MKKSLLLAAVIAAVTAAPVGAKSDSTKAGGLSPQHLERIKSAYQGTPADKAIHNALAGTDINVLALNAEKRGDKNGGSRGKIIRSRCNPKNQGV